MLLRMTPRRLHRPRRAVVSLLTTGEAATRLHVTDETVRRWIAAGKIPAITLPSGQFRIPCGVVDDILAGTVPVGGDAS